MAKIDALTLYHYPLSRSLRVRYLLEEIGAPHGVVKLDMMQGEGMSEAHLARNPNHAVPVLDIDYDDGTRHTMIESGAMMLFLADAFPDAGLAPDADNGAARADYLAAMLFHSAHLDMSLWQIRLNETLFPKPVRSSAIAQFNRDKIEREMIPQMEARVADGGWMCGDTFTAVDCIAAQNVNWMRAYGMARSGPLDAYIKRHMARETWQRATADAAEFER